MTGVPVLLLDIDGVVNAISSGAPKDWPSFTWKQDVHMENGQAFPLMWCELVVDYLTHLSRSGRVEVRYHTSWQESAHEFSRKVGLPEFPIHPCPEHMANPSLFSKQQILAMKPTWWKFPAAERVLTVEKRPLIWVDDELVMKLTRSAREKMATLGKVGFVSPPQHCGLIGKHLRRIEEFLLVWEEASGACTGS